MAIANYNEEKPLIIYTFKKLCNGEQRLAAQQYKGICKCNSSRFRDETSNMAKFTELKETSFYDR